MKKKITRFIAIILMPAFFLAGCLEMQTFEGEGMSTENFRWQISTPWTNSMFTMEMPTQWAESVEKATGGRLSIEVHPAGAIVGAGEVMDATEAGSIDGYHAATNMWMGKMEAAPLFTTIPMIMDPSMRLSWTYEGGGLELWQRMYDESNLNIKVIPLGMTGPEVLAWSNTEMSALEDWNGIIYRSAGIWAEILKKRGVSVTTTPAGEIYQSMERGLVDAINFSTPHTDRTLGFYEVADYFTGPSIHQPTTMYYLGIDKDKWDELPEDIQEIVMQTAKSTTLSTYLEDLDKSMEANAFYFEEHGIEQVKMDDEVQHIIQEETIEYLDQQAEIHGGFYEETWNAIQEYRESYIDYKDLMTPDTE